MLETEKKNTTRRLFLVRFALLGGIGFFSGAAVVKNRRLARSGHCRSPGAACSACPLAARCTSPVRKNTAGVKRSEKR